MVKIPVVAIVGRPNVGKSTLFNRLTGGRFAIESDVEGTTRDRIYRTIQWNRKNFSLVDTAGLFFDQSKMLKTEIQTQIEAAIEKAEILLLVLDGNVGLTKEDESIIRLLRKQSKPVLVVANKLDRKPRPEEIAEFNKSGLGEPIPVSALHGRGTGDLLDEIALRLPHAVSASTRDGARVALIGRPNVGKSSLLNTITKKQRAVVSETPGTTRDYIEEQVTYHGSTFTFVDTAGIRRRGKVERGIEQFSVLRSMKSIENSDITLLVLDATDPALSQDQHIAGFAKDAGKALILVVNKWDLVEKESGTMEKELAKLRQAFDFIPWAPVIFVSAVTGTNVNQILELLNKTIEEATRNISTPQLNNFFQDLVLQRTIPGSGRYQPKLFYATQTQTKPPTFTLFLRDADKVHFSWARFAENQIRAKWGFAGTPIRLHLRERRTR